MTTSRPRGMFPPEYPFPERPSAPKPESIAPPVPVVYEESELEKMPLRAYAAIQLRVPDSGIEWLDKMIEKSRQLDRESR
ncbi:MAG TPA: hypothetical protein VMH80_05935 [Bryobacteraceae bacterium]|nr:hypothetical protein [Bryobacteraceae bacterium]